MDAVSPAVDRINIDSIKIDCAMTRRDVGLMNKPDVRSQSNALTKGSHVIGTAVPPAGPGLTVTPGLKGVVVAETEISDVLGDVGVYHYRGLPATDLARLHTFEAVWSWVNADRRRIGVTTSYPADCGDETRCHGAQGQRIGTPLGSIGVEK